MKYSENLRSIVGILFKNKSSIVGILAVTLTVIIIGTVFQDKNFTATSNLLVKFGRQYVYNPATTEVRNPENYFNRDGIIDTEVEIFMSRDLRLQVIEKIGVGNLYPDLSENNFLRISYLIGIVDSFVKKVSNTLGFPVKVEEKPSLDMLSIAEQRFVKNLNVIGNPQSSIIRISFTHNDPNKAAEAINSLVDLYQQDRLQIFSDPGVPDFLDAKVKYYDQSRTEFLDKITKLRQENQVYSYPDQLSILVKQRADLRYFIEESNGQIIVLQDKVGFLEKQLSTVSNGNVARMNYGRGNQAVDNAKKELLDLKLKEQELLQRFKEGSQQIVNVRQAINTVNLYLRTQESVAGNLGSIDGMSVDVQREYFLAMIELRGLKVKKDEAAKQLKNIETELQSLTIENRELDNYIRDLNVSEKNYNLNLEKLDQVNMAKEMDQNMLTNIRIIQKAVAPIEPSSPNMKMNVVIGTILGVFCGLILAFLKEYNNQGVNSQYEATKYLELPVLATIAQKTSNS